MLNWLQNMKISNKLLMSFLPVIVAAFLFNLLGLRLMYSMVQSGNTEHYQQMILILLAIMVLALILSLFLIRFVSRIIAKPIEKFTTAAEMLAEGDISISNIITEKDHALSLRKDEIGRMAVAIGKIIRDTQEQAEKTQAIAAGDLTVVVTPRSERDIMGLALAKLVQIVHDLVAGIASSADQVDSGARLVSESSAMLSQGAEEQASSVQQLTASLEEITAQTGHNAKNAENANALAIKARKNADIGNTQMQEMLKAMDEINHSSSNINSIIKVIEDIAFQTNILALNAAVEAARAGQYGRGFAVVAEEVRNLAARSSKAASETTSLIESSIQKVEDGTRIAKSTADALNNIVGEVDKTADLVSLILQASQEQAVAIDQINQGIAQVSQVVQTNAATSEEGAAASQELAAQASQLKESVQGVKIRQNQAAPALAEKPAVKQAETIKPVKAGAVPEQQKPTIILSDNEFGKY